MSLPAPVYRRQNAFVNPPCRGTRWVGTINNYTDEESGAFDNIVASYGTIITYIVVGIEVGLGTETPHLQFYLETKETQRRAALLKIPGLGRAFLELAKGTKAQNYEYCTKEGNWREFGKPKPGQGKRCDLDAVEDAIKEGADLREISQRFFGPFVRYHAGIGRYMNLNQQPASRDRMKMKWFWGPTGSGKTGTLKSMAGLNEGSSNNVYWVQGSPTGTWWTGYCGEKIVLMDELRGSWFPHCVALRIFDRTPYRVPVHGGNMPLQCQLLMVTSNNPPHMLYDVDDAGAFMRRIRDYCDVYELLHDRVRITSSALVKD